MSGLSIVSAGMHPTSGCCKHQLAGLLKTNAKGLGALRISALRIRSGTAGSWEMLRESILGAFAPRTDSWSICSRNRFLEHFPGSGSPKSNAQSLQWRRSATVRDFRDSRKISKKMILVDSGGSRTDCLKNIKILSNGRLGGSPEN